MTTEQITILVAYAVMVGMMFAGLFAWWFGRDR